MGIEASALSPKILENNPRSIAQHMQLRCLFCRLYDWVLLS